MFYHGDFIQLVQSLLWWKIIKLNPLHRYQGSKDLLKITIEEATQLLTITFLDSVAITNKDSDEGKGLLQVLTFML